MDLNLMNLNAEDPLVVMLTIVITYALRRLAERLTGKERTRLHGWAPTIAVAIATGLNVTLAVITEENAITADTLRHGLVAGLTAVYLHTQARGAKKPTTPPTPKLEEPTE